MFHSDCGLNHMSHNRCIFIWRIICFAKFWFCINAKICIWFMEFWNHFVTVYIVEFKSHAICRIKCCIIGWILVNCANSCPSCVRKTCGCFLWRSYVLLNNQINFRYHKEIPLRAPYSWLLQNLARWRLF